MGKNIKPLFVSNLLALLRQLAGNQQLTKAQAVTAMVKAGIATGTAQRLLDEASDVQMGTAQAALAKLGVSLQEMLSDSRTVDEKPAPKAQLSGALGALAELPPKMQDEFSRVLALFIETSSPLYGQRLAELLGTQAQPQPKVSSSRKTG
jgi:hypothetical protein